LSSTTRTTSCLSLSFPGGGFFGVTGSGCSFSNSIIEIYCDVMSRSSSTVEEGSESDQYLTEVGLYQERRCAIHLPDKATIVGMKIYAQLSHLFPYYKAGLAYIKSFDGLWTFVLLSNRELNPVNKETPNLKLKYFEADKVPFYTKLPPFLENKFKYFRENGFKSLATNPTFMGPVKFSETVKDLIDKA